MNLDNQQRGESQHYKLWFEAGVKSIWESDKHKACELNDFSEGKNYNLSWSIENSIIQLITMEKQKTTLSLCKKKNYIV